MDSDDRSDTLRQFGTFTMDQTLTTAPLNNTIDFLGANNLGQTTVNYTEMLDETSRDLLKHGFKKMAKKNDYIRIDEIGDAFRHSGQNPKEDTVKDLVEKAKKLKIANHSSDDEDEKPDDHLTFADYLTVVHDTWVPIEDDKAVLQESFDILDPQNKSKLMVDDFAYLLKNSDWPDEEIELLLSQVSCADGYFLLDDLQRLLLTPIETAKKKSAKSKKKTK